MNHYYVFCENLVAVKTSFENFRWVFGRGAPDVSISDYNKCLVHLCVDLENDRYIADQCGNDMLRFGDYYGYIGDNQIIFNKHLKSFGHIAYKISRQGNYLNVVIGKNYFRLIKYKVMHLHPMYFILFDFVTAVLLDNGYTSLYSSAVKLQNGKTVIMIAHPNTGKSLTSLRLVNDFGASLISEDVAITDGEYIWPVPYTNSYRNYRSIAHKGNERRCNDAEKADYLFWLSKGEHAVEKLSVDDIYKIQLLNDYLLYYAKSPVIDAFSYFNNCFKNMVLLERENAIIKKLIQNVTAKYISESDALRYAQIILSETF